MRPPRAGRGRGAALAALCLGALGGLAPGGAAPCFGQSSSTGGEESLRSEFWAEMEPVPGGGEAWPVLPEEARARILDEAAWVFGGMIWGFEFRYTPYDKTRGLEERFSIEPIRSLAPGDLSVSPVIRASSPEELRCLVEYRLEPGLVSLRESYAEGPWKGAQGLGKADMNLGAKGRRAAYEDGMRAALRSLLQGAEPNKPRLARGRVVLDRPPSMAIIGGFYTAQLRVRATVIEVLPYRVY